MVTEVSPPVPPVRPFVDHYCYINRCPGHSCSHPASDPYPHHPHHGFLLVEAPWDGLPSDEKKEMIAIAAGGLAGRQPKDDEFSMKDVVDDEPMPTSSPRVVHCIITIGEARAHYMDIVREELFREAQADAAYNHHLLQEHVQEEEQFVVSRAVAPGAT
ncbi:u-box domain-containing protein 33 [Hordeum vulgare]|nr:u-box domain-containing protein 33 [Hordeum vulgare]